MVDRLVVRSDIEKRLADTFETILKISDGLAYVENVDTKETITFSEKFSCPESGFTLEEIEPRLFSFNSPFGACPTCDGLGMRLVFDQDRVVPNPNLSIREGALDPWFGPFENYYFQVLESVAQHYDVSLTTPFKKLSQDMQNIFLYGSGKEKIKIEYHYGRRHQSTKSFEGVIPNLERRWRETESERAREELSKYQTSVSCDTCTSYRLKPEALSVKINHLHIGEVSQFSIEDAHGWFEKLEAKLTEKQKRLPFVF